MDLGLTAEQSAVRDTFAALFRRESPPERVRAAEETGLDRRLWQKYADLGALGIGVPATLGGGDGGLLELALVAEEAGRRLASIPVVRSAVAARLLGKIEAKELLEPVLNGSRIATLATGTDPLPRRLLVDGAVSDAVVAWSGGELRWVERPGDDATVPRSNVGGLPMAQWTVADGGVTLADARFGWAHFETALDELRVLLAAALVGVASESIDIGIRYVTVREAFGQPIGMFQAVAHPFADLVSARDGAQLLAWKACWALESGQSDGPALAAMAFVLAAETAYQAAAHSLHVHGGYGFMEEYDIQLYYRRAKAWATSFADPQRELLTAADRRFGPAGRNDPRG